MEDRHHDGHGAEEDDAVSDTVASEPRVSRRRALKTLGGAGAAALGASVTAGSATATSVNLGVLLDDDSLDAVNQFGESYSITEDAFLPPSFSGSEHIVQRKVGSWGIVDTILDPTDRAKYLTGVVVHASCINLKADSGPTWTWDVWESDGGPAAIARIALDVELRDFGVDDAEISMAHDGAGVKMTPVLDEAPRDFEDLAWGVISTAGGFAGPLLDAATNVGHAYVTSDVGSKTSSAPDADTATSTRRAYSGTIKDWGRDYASMDLVFAVHHDEDRAFDRDLLGVDMTAEFVSRANQGTSGNPDIESGDHNSLYLDVDLDDVTSAPRRRR